MIITCKCCGEKLEIKDGLEVIECPFCLSKQTLPNLKHQENILNLFNKANNLRQVCDFDNSIKVFKDILKENKEDSEAYFGIFLSKYGIEYVKDPQSKMMIPTCHRLTNKDILQDKDYLNAIKYADSVRKDYYLEEAKKISKILKSIYKLSEKEEPYDIFISFKDLDTYTNERTTDSLLAEEIYNLLTEKGYKVFFSRITLENRLGEAFEPIIYSALRSSKVMLTISTDKEYINATWVKNEWSRYLEFMKEDNHKFLIPCYKEMDLKDLPEAFRSLQCQDLNKVGAYQDLVRGIDKIFNRTEVSKKEVKDDSKINKLFIRVNICLENNDFNKADELLEAILNEDPYNAKAYFYKYLVSKNFKSEDDLILSSHQELSFDEAYLLEALKFSNEDYKKHLLDLNNKITLKENNLNYQKALTYYDQKAYLKAIEYFKKVIDYKDSKEKLQECLLKFNEANYEEALNLIKENKYEEALKSFKEIINYKDSKAQIEICEDLISKNQKLETAKALANDAIKENYIDEKKFKEAKEILESLGDFNGAKECLNSYNENYNRISEKIKKARYRLIDKEIKKRKITIISVVVGALVLLLAVLIPTISLLIKNNSKIELKYIYNDNDLTAGVSIELGSYVHEYEIEIPRTTTNNGKVYQITKINDGCFRNTGLKKIIIPDSITYIGDNAFSECEKLESITIPDSVTSIGESAFSYCYKLKNVKLPKNLKIIESELFEGCEKLESIEIPDDITEIKALAFENCINLKNVKLPKYLLKIYHQAFGGCCSLENITLPDNLISIEYEAFAYCKNLKNIIIPKNVSMIGRIVFLDCNNLTIYAEIKDVPYGWDINWNPDKRPVVWDYKNK